MASRILLPLVFALITSVAFAQVGTIKGNLKDATTGEGIIGGNVLIEGLSIGAATDIEGNFVIPKVKAGTYNLVITYISYKTKTIPNVQVYPDQTTVINTSIEEDVQKLDDVVITAKRQTDTDISVITELKKADLIAVGISSQMIQMSQDRDASQVIRRVPGVTIVGNRFVNVRGLSERYSTVMLNGIIAPSTEVDSKAFAFDLIPSNMIDRMMVYKSGSPELPGEFAGADINIYTKSIVDENSANLSISGSYRFGTTGNSNAFLGSYKSNMDWAGFGAKGRDLPAAFPKQILTKLDESQEEQKLVNASKLLPNNWAMRNFTASPDFRINFDISRTIHLGNMKLDNITAISYAHTNQFIKNIKTNYYDQFDQATQANIPRYEFNDTRFTQVNRLGAISNFTLTINPSHKIEFRNFYNQQGQNQATIRKGYDNGINGDDVNNIAINYFSRGLYSGQLSGKHSFSDAVNFNWALGYNNTKADRPDYMRARSQRTRGTDNEFAVQIPPTSSLLDAARFFSKLNENAYTFAGNLDIKLNPYKEESKQSKLIAGYYIEKKDREFDARWMAYGWTQNGTDISLTTQSFEQLFAPENIGTHLVLKEGTNVGPNRFDRYDGHSQLLAGYAGIVTPFADKWRLTGGLRVESNRQMIDVYDENDVKSNKVDATLVVPMPFVNLSYSFTDKMLIRVAYSKTVNRPMFRELAPFQFYDFEEKNADFVGNPNLKTARIDNIDLKWELYPSNAENITFGVFYKNFINPIEVVLTPGSNLFYTYENADYARSYGVEAELRKSLENVDNGFLKRLTFVFNGALIKSNTVMPDRLDNLLSNRAMQGQSPYMINASIFYAHPETGWQASLMYNVFGKRISAVGDKDSNPNQYEMSRHQVDLTITKRLTEKLEVKFGIADIFNQAYRFIEDSNYDKKITKVDGTIQSYRLGQYTTLGLNWRF